MLAINKVSELQRAVCLGGVLALSSAPANAWEPTHPIEIIVPAGTGGGADQMARDDAGHHHQAQSVEAVGRRHQQVGRRRRRRLPRRQECEGRRSQADHHAVEPVHHAARHRHSLQLEGHHPGRDDGARRVRALGQRRQAVQVGEGLRRRHQGRARQHLQDGRHRLQAGRPDHHRRARKGDRQEDDLHPVQRRRRGRGAARRQPRRFDGQQSDRGGGALARRQVAAALRVRRQEARLSRQDRRRSGVERRSRPASRRGSTSNT